MIDKICGDSSVIEQPDNHRENGGLIPTSPLHFCVICNKSDVKLMRSFGKYYCKQCLLDKPKSGLKGNSGMVLTKDRTIQEGFCFNTEIELIQVPKSNRDFSNLYLTHYPGSKGIVGRQLNYLIERGGKILGIISVASPPLNYKKFNAFFGNKFNEKNWLNNNAFRLIETEKNLGTKVLKMFRYRIKTDYEKKYGDKLIGIITFVEPPRTGALYKADNWIELGITEGKKCVRRGTDNKWFDKTWLTGTPKFIYGYKYK